MDEWNEGVDKYIATQGDSRSREVIERCAKIALDGGPLYKRCEAASCERVEGVDVDHLKRCSKCKRVCLLFYFLATYHIDQHAQIFYCSQTCQKDDWARHKTECSNQSHPFQTLRSQRAQEAATSQLATSLSSQFASALRE